MENNYRELNNAEIKEIELKILKYITDFCEENNINYVLSDGTLIGAVRHQGFIPWDLDIDISMLRTDYERFMELWKDSNDYALISIDNMPKSAMSFIKIVDMNTICYEHNLKTVKGGLWVDIFPLDALPTDENELESHYKKIISLYEKYNRSYWLSRHNFIASLMRRFYWSIYFSDISLLWESVGFRYKKLYKEATKYSNQEYKNIVNKMIVAIRPKSRMYGFPKSVLTDFIYTKFEQFEFRIPKDYDSMLRCYYGNYMELPPEEKRVDHHVLKTYKIEEK